MATVTTTNLNDAGAGSLRKGTATFGASLDLYGPIKVGLVGQVGDF